MLPRNDLRSKVYLSNFRMKTVNVFAKRIITVEIVCNANLAITILEMKTLMAAKVRIKLLGKYSVL